MDTADIVLDLKPMLNLGLSLVKSVPVGIIDQFFFGGIILLPRSVLVCLQPPLYRTRFSSSSLNP